MKNMRKKEVSVSVKASSYKSRPFTMCSRLQCSLNAALQFFRNIEALMKRIGSAFEAHLKRCNANFDYLSCAQGYVIVETLQQRHKSAGDQEILKYLQSVIEALVARSRSTINRHQGCRE